MGATVVPQAEYPVRSLYMRLYRSRVEGEAAYHILPGDCIERLVSKGHAEPAGAGYRMTVDGVRAWAVMNEHLIFRIQSVQLKSYDELRKELHNMANISAESLQVLEQLVEHEDGLPDEDFDVGLRGLLRWGYIVRQGKQLFITDKGTDLLNQRATGNESMPEAKPRRSRISGLTPRNGHVFDGALAHSDMARATDVRGDAVIDDALARTRSAHPANANGTPAPFAPAPPFNPPAIAPVESDACAIDCEKCLKARVLDMVAEKLPEVRDLLEAVRAEDEAQRSRESILKAIGK